jgi:esterase/lipase
MHSIRACSQTYGGSWTERRKRYIGGVVGRFSIYPSAIGAPVLIERGAWDSLTTDADAANLLDKPSSEDKRDVKMPEATHLMHLEHSREGLFAAMGEFLAE